jgi:hypothetical protein
LRAMIDFLKARALKTASPPAAAPAGGKVET